MDVCGDPWLFHPYWRNVVALQECPKHCQRWPHCQGWWTNQVKCSVLVFCFVFLNVLWHIYSHSCYGLSWMKYGNSSDWEDYWMSELVCLLFNMKLLTENNNMHVFCVYWNFTAELSSIIAWLTCKICMAYKSLYNAL